MKNSYTKFVTAENSPGNANACFTCPAREYDFRTDTATCNGSMDGNEPLHCPKTRGNGYTTRDMREHLKNVWGK